MPLSLKAGKCCCCKDGAVIPKWLNLTKVRATDDTLPPAYDCDPYLRYDRTQYDLDNGSGACAAITTGCQKCGVWLVGGDKNGLPAQEITDTVPDIMTCAANDSTHQKSDHNCYEKSGTVDMRQTERKGGQWILARKNWHGCFGWTSKDACANPKDYTPDQTKYLTATFDADYSDIIKWWDLPTATTYNSTQLFATASAFSRSVSKDAGLSTQSGNITEVAWNHYYDGSTPVEYKQTDMVNGVGTYFIDPINSPPDGVTWPVVGGDAQTPGSEFSASGKDTLKSDIDSAANIGCGGNIATMAGIVDEWNTLRYTYGGNSPITPPDMTGDWTFDDTFTYTDTSVVPNATATCTISASVTRTNTVYSWDLSWTIDVDNPGSDATPDIRDWTYSGTLTLSDPYSAADCYSDFKDLLKEFDMSDFSLAHLREDEKLALAALVCRDEVNPTSPLDGWQYYRLVDDYNSPATDRKGSLPWTYPIGGTPPADGWTESADAGQADDWIPTFEQIDWQDTQGFIWRYKNYAGDWTYNQPLYWSEAGKLTTADGSIIAHNPSGYERHFWFNFNEWERVPDTTVDCAGNFIWNLLGRGAYSPTELSKATLRWMDRLTAQYDIGPFCDPDVIPHAANFPQAFINQGQGVIWGAKYVEPAFAWPSANYGRPCGPDRYAVNQTTVCAFVGTNRCEDGTFTVKKTGNAIAPVIDGGTATGGIKKDDYVASDTEGFYKILGIAAGTDPDTFDITVGAKIDDLPTGWQMAVRDDTDVPAADYIGKLRWVNYTRNGSTISMPAPICGRAACTTSETGGIVTVEYTANQPYLRKDVTTGKIIVDLWNAAHTVKVAAAVELTRVDDNTFTYAGTNPNAAWATGKDYVWTDHDETSKRTGVKNEWTFDNRKAQTGYSGPDPVTSWYDDMLGCLANDKEEFTYDLGNCRAMVGIVPHYSGVPQEDFKNQVLFDFPATFPFDDAYGAHWQAEVAMVMDDPFWQAPFVPDGNLGIGETMELIEDDGSGHVSGKDGSVYTVYYPHRRWVEAAKDIPAGKHLPDVLSLTYANDVRPVNNSTTFYNVVDGAMFNGGIKIGDDEGNYASLETVYGFRNRACATIAGLGNFADTYAEFVPC